MPKSDALRLVFDDPDDALYAACSEHGSLAYEEVQSAEGCFTCMHCGESVEWREGTDD